MSFDDFGDARDTFDATGAASGWDATGAAAEPTTLPEPTPEPSSTNVTPTPEPVSALSSLSDGARLASAVEMAAGTALADVLLGIDVTALSADEAVTFAQEWERVVAFAIAGREQARADVNGVLVRHFRAEDARYAEMARAENEQRVAAGLSVIPDGLTAGRGAGFVPRRSWPR